MSNSIREKLSTGQSTTLNNSARSAVAHKAVGKDQSQTIARLQQLARDLHMDPPSLESLHQQETPRTPEIFPKILFNILETIQRLLGRTQSTAKSTPGNSSQKESGPSTWKGPLQPKPLQAPPPLPSDLTPLEKSGKHKWVPMAQFNEVHFSVPKREGFEVEGIYIMGPDGRTVITQASQIQQSLFSESYDVKLQNTQLSSLPLGCVVVVEYKQSLRDRMALVNRPRDYVQIPDPQKPFKY